MYPYGEHAPRAGFRCRYFPNTIPSFTSTISWDRGRSKSIVCCWWWFPGFPTSTVVFVNQQGGCRNATMWVRISETDFGLWEVWTSPTDNFPLRAFKILNKPKPASEMPGHMGDAGLHEVCT